MKNEHNQEAYYAAQKYLAASERGTYTQYEWECTRPYIGEDTDRRIVSAIALMDTVCWGGTKNLKEAADHLASYAAGEPMPADPDDIFKNIEDKPTRPMLIDDVKDGAIVTTIDYRGRRIYAIISNAAEGSITYKKGAIGFSLSSPEKICQNWQLVIL